MSSSVYDALFHASTVDLHLPLASELLPLPDQADTHSSEAAQWWAATQSSLRAAQRSTAFFDEKFAYLLSLHIPFDAVEGSASGEPPADLVHFIARLQTRWLISQLTMAASFVAPVTRTKRDSQPQTASLQTPGAASSSLAVPGPAPPRTPQTATGPLMAPVTPNPFPAVAAADEAYAHVEGITVWEGNVSGGSSASGADERNGALIIRTDDGWVVVWRGEVPIVYVRTPIMSPILALTVSVTLRDQVIRARARGMSIETGSARSEGTRDAPARADDGVAGMAEMDLLGGLALDALPASRLGASARADLSLPARADVPPSPAVAPTAPSPLAPAATALRKSFRRVLDLSPGLRVRMRTLFLPQLLAPGDDDAAVDAATGERRIVVCVEVENSDATAHAFEVARVGVEVGGKGGKASAELACQPEGAGVFPLRLAPLEQYNLLYAISMASGHDGGGALDEAIARSAGRGDDQRPVSITLVGRPLTRASSDAAACVYPTAPFQSRWNCTLDLAPYYASLPASPPAPLVPTRTRPSAAATAPPAIAGDKRYSLATLSSDKDRDDAPLGAGAGPGPGSAAQQRRVVSQQQRPLLPSQAVSSRVASFRAPPHLPPAAPQHGHGLLVSVQVVAPPHAGGGTGIDALDTFAIEVFVHNRTEAVKRFHLSVPPRDLGDARVRDAWAERRRHSDWVADDHIIRALVAQHAATAPAVIPLENDVRCGPLLPGASLSARVRFLALRDGVHRIDRLRISGEDFDTTVHGVVDVVVGSGKA